MATQNDVRQAVYLYAAELMKKGVSASEIKSRLMAKGLDQSSASIVVKNLVAARAQAATKNMLYGALWCIGGIVVTALTYSAASGGGRYVIAWGAILFGAIQFLRGLWQYLTR